MSENIKKYFTSTNKAQPTLKRSRSSPEALNTPKRTQNIPGRMAKTPPKSCGLELNKSSIEQLMESFNKLLDSKKFSTKEDIDKLEGTIMSLKLENQKLQEEIVALKQSEEKGKRRMDYLENMFKQNNLLFRGFSDSQDRSCTETIVKLCNEVLEVDVNQQDVIHARWVGPKGLENRPILASFSQTSKVFSILRNTRKLRGTNLSIDRDLCKRTRWQRGKLLRIKKEVKSINKNIRVSVGGSQLWVNNVKFYWEDNVGLMHKGKEGIEVLNQLVGGDLRKIIKGLLGQGQEEPPPTLQK